MSVPSGSSMGELPSKVSFSEKPSSIAATSGGGLHRRAGLAAGDRPVDLGVEEVLAAEDAADRTGAGLDGGDADVELLVAEAVGPRLDDSLHRGVHRLPGEGGRDPQPAALDLVLVEAQPDQLVADHRQHVAALAAVLALLGDVGEVGEPLRRLLGLLGVDHPLLLHVVEDPDVPLLERALGPLALGGVEVVRVVEDAGEHDGLLEGEVLGVDVEVGLGGRLDAVGAATEVDGVEVALEDLLLADLPLQLQRDEGLLDLARDGALLGEVEDLHVLLGDRGGTLGVVAARVAERRADDALGVDPLVGPEGPVLGRDDGVLDRVGHLVERDRLAVLGRVLPELGLAVGVVDEAGLGLEVLVGPRGRRSPGRAR